MIAWSCNTTLSLRKKTLPLQKYRRVLLLCVQPIPREIRDGDYENDMQFRQHFQDWVSAIWTAKDAKIAQLMAETK